MKQFLGIFFALLLSVMMIFHSLAESQSGFPEALRFTVEHSGDRYLRDDVFVRKEYPVTSNEQVNLELRMLTDAMDEAGKPFLPKQKPRLHAAYLDIGCRVSRTGSRWMSFLTLARIASEREQTYVDFDARTYDMETGKRLFMTDLFSVESSTWELLSDEVRHQLTAFFPEEAPEEKKLAALCTRDTLENASFTLSPVTLTLHYRADSLYEGRNTLMHVRIPYSRIRDGMREEAQQQTDNRSRGMIALTYDDGCARLSSRNLMRSLRRGGANATFFIVGNTLRSNHDILSQEHDLGYEIASHSYNHEYTPTPGKLESDMGRYNREMSEIIGWVPTIMRAPGGYENAYAAAGLPMIHWSCLSGDTGGGDPDTIASSIVASAKPGSIILMHDLNADAWRYTEKILRFFEGKGWFCVSVSELCEYYGVPLKPGSVICGCEEEAAAMEVSVP